MKPSILSYCLFNLFCIAASFAVADEQEERAYEISSIELKYTQDHPQHPSLQKLKQIAVDLLKTEKGYAAPKKGGKLVKVELGKLLPSARFSASALQEIAKELIKYFHSKGLAAVHVLPQEIDEEGNDLREPGDEKLTLLISMATVEEIRTVSSSGEEIDHPRHAFIKENAPIHSSDLFCKDDLENYAHFLNRHPYRRVDIQLHSLNQPNAIGLDFLVTEDKSWKAYVNAGNTGPRAVSRWQESIGFMHAQLTGRDDIFRIDYTSDGFQSFYAVALSYDAPLTKSRRYRWKIGANNSRFSSAELGIKRKTFIGKQSGASLAMTGNIYQCKDLFIDVSESLIYLYEEARHRSLHEKTSQNFLSPDLRINIQKIQNDFKLFLDVDIQGTNADWVSSDPEHLYLLGRMDPSHQWAIITGKGFVSLFLDSLIKSDKKPPTLAHELSFLLQGQYAFDFRVIPTLKAVVGGLYTVRGYPQAINSGDNVIIARAEYAFHLPNLFAPEPQPKHRLFHRPFRVAPAYSGGRADWDLIFRGFVDAGRAVNNHKKPPEENSTLLGTGLGFELDIKQNVIIRGDWGIALKEAGVSAGHNEFYFTATLMY